MSNHYLKSILIKAKSLIIVYVFIQFWPTNIYAQDSIPITRLQALSHLHKLDVDRKDGLDRLIAISHQLSRAEFLHSVAQLRPPRLGTFTKSHLSAPNPLIRRAAYYALATMSTVNPMSWLPQQLTSLPPEAIDDRIALCESLGYSLHPSAAELLMPIYASDPTESPSLFDSCVTSAIYWVSLGVPLIINPNQAEILKTLSLNPSTHHGIEARALHLLTLLAKSPSLIRSVEQSKILRYFKESLELNLKSKQSVKYSYALMGLGVQHTLGLISEWWEVGQRTTLRETRPDLDLNIDRKLVSAKLMGSKEASPLSPLILQRYLDTLETAIQSKSLKRLTFLFDRRILHAYLSFIDELLNLRRLPKTLAREARRGIRLIDQAHTQTISENLNIRLSLDHLHCHLSALVDHSLRRLQLLPKCTDHPVLFTVIYRLSRRVIRTWGSHLKTKAIKSLFKLQNSTKVNHQWGLEILAQTLLDLKPMGQRRSWMQKMVKYLLTQRSIVAQAAMEIIAEHQMSQLTNAVVERLEQAITYDEYALITLGVKCLELLKYSELEPILVSLLNHPQTEISLLAQIMYHRLKPEASANHSAAKVIYQLDENISPSWSKPSSLKTFTLKLPRGDIKMRVSPHAFTLLKTLELALQQQFFDHGVVTSVTKNRVTFSTSITRPWTTWIYPPRSELSEKLNPKYLHNTWVLTWDPLTFDHFNEGWVFSKSVEALSLMKHGIIAEVYSGEELLENALIGDRVESVSWSTQSPK